ncbi:ATP synthase F0 subunit C [Pyrinomonas methylaliphatogenes]|jgi:F-type H+-transporting ATPase subunit c|uniref:ATP synthase subunit c n=1 Tax=Pyrinomonas methylaliphatogenes TaxID=454194 RepID=A0A0B6X0C4_9BACT|nr:ATP synthase F0 subunit C [Pyrinomonas methylaliphatogenes]MBX5478438.1 ATP synthase F0 subunit C [Pyrinomonas methylaliphatogenes]CDM66973.1 F0F1-type ATP synthase, subunit c/archaeal/vacuolar-type H+-ATPase, subunit K [Pyrinomonas methylaliphatogenes]
MNRLRFVLFSVLGMLMLAAPTFAQAAEVAADNAFTVSKYAKLAAGFGFGLAAGLAALGQSRVAAAAAEGAARNPGASGRIQTLMILGLVFIETLVLFTLLVAFLFLRV